MKLHACARVTAATGALAANCGFAAGANTGAGVVTLDFAATHQLDASRLVVIITPAAALAPSGLATFGVALTSDTRLTVTQFQEQAGGTASIAANVDFNIVVFDSAAFD